MNSTDSTGPLAWFDCQYQVAFEIANRCRRPYTKTNPLEWNRNCIRIGKLRCANPEMINIKKRRRFMPAVAPGKTIMKAVRIHSFGGPDVLRFEEVPIPEPKPDEVLVRVY